MSLIRKAGTSTGIPRQQISLGVDDVPPRPLYVEIDFIPDWRKEAVPPEPDVPPVPLTVEIGFIPDRRKEGIPLEPDVPPISSLDVEFVPDWQREHVCTDVPPSPISREIVFIPDARKEGGLDESSVPPISTLEVEFFPDSSKEGVGFEPNVPLTSHTEMVESIPNAAKEKVTPDPGAYARLQRRDGKVDSPSHKAAYERTRTQVRKAVSSIFGNSLAVEPLITDAPHPVSLALLGDPARVMLSMWYGVRDLTANRISSLHLIERCATILYSLRVELEDMDLDMSDVLRDPVQKLTESFRGIKHFIHEQSSRPFLKRYLQRDNDTREIMACDASLTYCVGLFDVTVHIRMLKEIEQQTHIPEFPDIPSSSGSNKVLSVIARNCAAKVAHDNALDRADLYAVMRDTLRKGSDVAMLDVLQIPLGEIKEAIRSLQRALEYSHGPQPEAHAESQTAADPSTSATSSKTSKDLSVSTQVASAATPTRDSEWDTTLHREFLESGLKALRRLSGAGGDESLPPWTITKWEIDRQERIGSGFFSDVYKGIWRGRQVAIKVLTPTTPRKLFHHEVAIWASLDHPHVLKLLGASSATGDPPWFFVSPYMKNGTLLTFLHAALIKGSPLGSSQAKYLRLMHEIATGMDYLHRQSVVHGNLKANNVLIDDDLRCVISDFGQSELRNEVYRLDNEPPPHGLLGWQAPEILGRGSKVTPEVDIYAFAVVCVEILANGVSPWTKTMRDVIRGNNNHPNTPPTPLGLTFLIERCWRKDPMFRPTFSEILLALQDLMDRSGAAGVGTNSQDWLNKPVPTPSNSLDVAPAYPPVAQTPHWRPEDVEDLESMMDSYGTPLPAYSSPPQRQIHYSPQGPISEQAVNRISLRDDHESPLGLLPSSLSTPEVAEGADHGETLTSHHPIPAQSVQEELSMSVNLSTLSISPHSSMEETDHIRISAEGHESIAHQRDERRYRLLLQHNFHPSLSIPLWNPSPLRLGDVGYLSSGRFIVLFNSRDPSSAPDKGVHGIPPLRGFGTVREVALRQNQRTIAQRGLNAIQELLTFNDSGSGGGTISKKRIARRYSFPWQADHKIAYLCTEKTMYRYMKDIHTAKAWFKSNITEIVEMCGEKHRIQREDVFFITGALEARDYGLFVGHEHSGGTVHFNVFANRRKGQEWGWFSIDTDPSSDPAFTDDMLGSVYASKVSSVRPGSNSPPHVVLISRLRFRPDGDEPTLS